jgi:signal transduction histidine kinase/CheY-like chemotaxis protein
VGSQLLALVHPDDLADSSSAVSRLGDGKNFPNFKNRYRHQDGSYRMIAWTAVPDSDYIHAVGRDIQAEEEAKDALRLSEDALRQSQKLEAIGQLTGGVAHDFNNLLTVIKSCADLLKTPSLSEVRRIKYVEAIASTVDRAARLTAQLLTFARRQALRPEVFNVGDSVLRVGEMMDSLTGSRIKVTIEVPDEPCFINADESQFDTALVNMVVNARDAMSGNGNLTIQVATAAWLPSVRAHPGRIADYVTITLSDTGTGIAPEKLDAIFEPFYTTKGIGQGTGLGLSQVFGFAKQSGGEILVQSECGKGSQFMLYLPKVEASTIPTAQDNHSAPIVSNLCVLMVEDNADVGLYTSQTLEQMGFHVLWVPDAKSALEALAPNPESFQVVFSDISMPGMSGLELLDVIEALYPWLPVVLTTGYNDEYARIAQEEAKRFVLLQKPYATETLALLLQKVVKGRLGRSLGGEIGRSDLSFSTHAGVS